MTTTTRVRYKAYAGRGWDPRREAWTGGVILYTLEAERVPLNEKIVDFHTRKYPNASISTLRGEDDRVILLNKEVGFPGEHIIVPISLTKKLYLGSISEIEVELLS